MGPTWGLLRLFRLATFTWRNVTATAVAIGEFSLVFTLPLFLINALGLSAMGSGLVLAAMAVGAFLASATGPFGPSSQAAVDALTSGFAASTPLAALASGAFLALGFLRALRVRVAAGHEVPDSAPTVTAAAR